MARKSNAATMVQDLQRKYAEGALSPRMIAKCEAMPGWDWQDDPKMEKNPSDTEREALIAHWRKRHAEGTLPSWKVRRLEQMPGWSWA